MLNIAVKKNRNITGDLATKKTFMAKIASVSVLILHTTSLFLHNVCQYDTRSLLARPKTDVVTGVGTRGQAAPTDVEINSI